VKPETKTPLRQLIVLLCLSLLGLAVRTARAARPELVLQAGHVDRVTAVACSRDGRYIVSGGWDGLIKLWDAHTGDVVRTLRAAKDLVPVTFAPDSHTIVSGGYNNTVRLWDVRSGKLLRVLKGHSDDVLVVAVSPDGKTIASGDLTGNVRLWDAHSGAPRAQFPSPHDLIESFAFSPDSRVLAAGSVKIIRLWNVATRKLLRTWPAHSKLVTGVAFSPDGRLLASCSKDLTARLWDWHTGKLLRTFKGHREEVEALTISPDGRTLATGGGEFDQSAELRLWDLKTGAFKRELKGHTGFVSGLAYTPDGATLVSSSWDKTVKLWDAANGRLLRTLYGQGAWMKSIAYSPDGRLLASASHDGTVKLWDTASGALKLTLTGHTAEVNAVAFAPDGKTLASAGGDATVRLWDVATGTQRRVLKGERGDLNTVAFSPDGATVATGGWDPDIYLWDVATGALRAQLGAQGQWTNCVAFSPDGRTLAFGGSSQEVFLGDIATQTIAHTMRGFKAEISALAFTPDGGSMAVASADNSLTLWDLATGKWRVLSHGEDWNLALAFAPDGKTLAAGGNQNDIKLYDVATGTVRARLTAEFDWIWTVAFAPDGKTLAAGPADNTVRLFDTGSGRLLATLLPIPAVTREVAARAIEIGAKDVGQPANEWFAMTPEGYFDCSTNAARFIRWRVGERLLPAERYLRRFRRPDLVQQALRHEAITESPFTTEDVPPVAHFVAFKYAAVDRKTVLVTVETQSRHPVRTEDVTLLVNGRPLPPEALQPVELVTNAKTASTGAKALEIGAKALEIGAKAIEIGAKPIEIGAKPIATDGGSNNPLRVQRLTYRIPLPLGAREVRLRAIAFDTSGLGSDWVEMIPLLRPGVQPVPGNLYVLCAGISHYRNADGKGFKNLQFAAGDARDMAARLLREGAPLYKKVEIYHGSALTDDEATVPNLRAGLKWLQHQVRPGQVDTVVVFLSGHGISDAQGRYFFPGHEFDVNHIAGTSLSGEELQRELGSRLRAQNVFLFVDSCHSGALAGARTSDLNFEVSSSGVYMMASSGSLQSSYEYAGWHHGAFTLALLRSLARRELAQQGVIHFDMLTFAVPDEISRLLRAADQNPNAQEPVVPLEGRTLNAAVAEPRSLP
jgi:WD40 repeat protein